MAKCFYGFSMYKRRMANLTDACLTDESMFTDHGHPTDTSVFSGYGHLTDKPMFTDYSHSTDKPMLSGCSRHVRDLFLSSALQSTITLLCIERGARSQHTQRHALSCWTYYSGIARLAGWRFRPGDLERKDLLIPQDSAEQHQCGASSSVIHNSGDRTPEIVEDLFGRPSAQTTAYDFVLSRCATSGYSVTNVWAAGSHLYAPRHG